MTTPDVPPFDAGNSLLGESPALMTTALLPTPGGQRLALTIRTTSTTITVLLNREDGQNWGRQILATVNQMSKAGLIVAGTAMPVNGNGAGM